MLIVLSGIPVTAQGEAVFGEKAVAQIGFINFVGEALAAVSIHFTARRGNISASVAVFVKDHIRVIVRVNINGKAVCVL